MVLNIQKIDFLNKVEEVCHYYFRIHIIDYRY